MKIVYQGIPGSYSEACAQKNYPGVETIACKTFDECFEIASQDNSIKTIIPESNKTCLLYTSPSPRDLSTSRMPSSA